MDRSDSSAYLGFRLGRPLGFLAEGICRAFDASRNHRRGYGCHAVAPRATGKKTRPTRKRRPYFGRTACHPD